jgi:hypothetical protein
MKKNKPHKGRRNELIAVPSPQEEFRGRQKKIKIFKKMIDKLKRKW